MAYYNHYALKRAEKNGVCMKEKITRRELIAWVDDPDGMEAFMQWLVGDARTWPEFVTPFR